MSLSFSTSTSSHHLTLPPDATSRTTSGTRAPAASRWWQSSRWCAWQWAPQRWCSCCFSWSSSASPRSSTCSRRRTRSCASEGEAQPFTPPHPREPDTLLELCHVSFKTNLASISTSQRTWRICFPSTRKLLVRESWAALACTKWLEGSTPQRALRLFGEH